MNFQHDQGFERGLRNSGDFQCEDILSCSALSTGEGRLKILPQPFQ